MSNVFTLKTKSNISVPCCSQKKTRKKGIKRETERPRK